MKEFIWPKVLLYASAVLATSKQFAKSSNFSTSVSPSYKRMLYSLQTLEEFSLRQFLTKNEHHFQLIKHIFLIEIKENFAMNIYQS